MAKKLILSNNQHIAVLCIKDIVYFETNLGHITVHYMENDDMAEFTFDGTLKSLESRLKGYGFIRIHRCYLAALDRICRLDSHWVGLSDKKKTRLPIGETYAASVRAAIMNEDAEIFP